MTIAYGPPPGTSWPGGWSSALPTPQASVRTRTVALVTPETEPITPGWRFVSIGFEGAPAEIRGVDVWSSEWSSTGGRVTVAHPSYPAERHTMFTYEVDVDGGTVSFAAGEFSNGVWGFFEPS
jgi:hypothetical protein